MSETLRCSDCGNICTDFSQHHPDCFRVGVDREAEGDHRVFYNMREENQVSRKKRRNHVRFLAKLAKYRREDDEQNQ